MTLYFVKTDAGRCCVIALDEIERTAAVKYDGDDCNFHVEGITPYEVLEATALLEDLADFDTLDFDAVYEDINSGGGLEILSKYVM